MIREISQIQEIDIHHIDPLDLNHLQFHDHKLLIVVDIVIENPTLSELDQVQETPNCMNNEENIYLKVLFLSETIVTVYFRSNSRNRQYFRNIIFLCIALH